MQIPLLFPHQPRWAAGSINSMQAPQAPPDHLPDAGPDHRSDDEGEA
jgi:hypothetical protein